MPYADGLLIEDSIMLESLARSSEPPTDVEKAAGLLRRWMHLSLSSNSQHMVKLATNL